MAAKDGRRRVLAFFVAALLILSALLAGVTWLPLRSARAHWRAGRDAEAIKTAAEWSRLRIWSRQYQQLLAAAQLTSGRRAQAEPHLRALAGGSSRLPALQKSEVANRLFARRAYADFLAYDAADSNDDGDTPLYRAAAQLALGKVNDAEATLRNAGAADAAKLALLRKALEERRSGKFAVAFDRRGAPLDEVLFEKLPKSERIETTLDAAIQELAEKALGDRRGALVAIDPRTNEILAVAGSGGLEKQYEPGSVIKVLTLLAANESNVSVDFPYTCAGALPIDGRRFGDWREGGHGAIPDLHEALAQSCNVVFADIGVRLGRDKLRDVHSKALFDTQLPLGLFAVPLGKTESAEVFNKFETAFFAIGLEHETVTPLHLAMIASMLANRGALTTPKIYSARRSLLGEIVERAPQQKTTQVASRASAEKVIEAMQAVVTREKGTARRAAIEGVSLAAKTGTAGEEANGFDALLLGFAPVEQPKIAFALVAENGGPAQFAAAKIAHDFLAGLKAAGHL